MRVQLDGGEIVELGETEATPTIGIMDYSRRETDDFGVTTVVERGFSRRMSVRLVVPFAGADTLQRRLANLRATSALWVASDDLDWLSVRGFYKDFSIDLATPPVSFCTLTVEGLAETESYTDTGVDPAPQGWTSTLRLLQPQTVTDAVLTSSSVPEADHPEWSAVATYPNGTRVIKAATHRIYESVSGGNVGNDPSGNSGTWVEVGATNRWAMFDQALGSLTTAAGSIAMTLNPIEAVTAFALLDVTGASVRVQAAGYDRTIAPASQPGMTLFLDMPSTATAITVTIAGGGAVSVGTLLLGRLVGLGMTESSPTAGITDYSRKEVDDFGEVTVVERAWAKRMSVNGRLRTDAIDAVASRIAAVRAIPSLWIGDEGLETITIYGFFRDFSIEVGPNVSKLSLSIEGLSAATQLAPLPQGPVKWPDVIDSDPEWSPKPEDGATKGTPPGTPLGDRMVDDVLEEFEAAKDAIDGLFATYGDTASAANSANIAQQAAENVSIAEGLVAAAKIAVEEAEEAAIAKAEEAAGSAQSAAGSAQVTIEKADEAAGSASSATASANISRSAASASFPNGFTPAERQFWTYQEGNPNVADVLSYTDDWFGSAADPVFVTRPNQNGIIATRGTFVPVPGRKYKVTIGFQRVADVTNGRLSKINFGFARVDAAGVWQGVTTEIDGAASPLNVWQTASWTWEADDKLLWARPRIHWNWHGGSEPSSDAAYHLREIDFEDVTESLKSGAFAEASAVSSQSSATKATEAGQSASAALLHSAKARLGAAQTFPRDFIPANQDQWILSEGTPDRLNAAACGPEYFGSNDGSFFYWTKPDATEVFSSRGVFKPIVGRKYRFTVIVEKNVAGTNGRLSQSYFGANAHRANGAFIGGRNDYIDVDALPMHTKVTRSFEWEPTGDYADTAYAYLRFHWNWDGLGQGIYSDARLLIHAFGYDDITSESASAGSAYTAGIARDEAGVHAGAALTSRTATETARGQAETYRNQASTSKDSAGQSAQTASEQAGLSAQARNDAGGYASAAAGSAGTASTKADAAGVSANSAQTAFVSARTQASATFPSGFGPSMRSNWIADEGNADVTNVPNYDDSWFGGADYPVFATRPNIQAVVAGRSTFAPKIGRRYRLVMEIARVVEGTNGRPSTIYLGFIRRGGGAYTYHGTDFNGLAFAFQQRVTITHEWTCEGLFDWSRMRCHWNHDAGQYVSFSNAEYHIFRFNFDDITESKAAADSASSSFASAQEAGDKATAASGYNDSAYAHAEDARGSANSSAGSAGASEDAKVVATNQAAAAQRSAVLSASVGAASMNANSRFIQYDATSGPPPWWGDWSNGYARTARTTGEMPNTYALHMWADENQNVGLTQEGGAGMDGVRTGDYVVLEADVRLVWGRLQGSGMYMGMKAANGDWRGDRTINFGFEPDSSGNIPYDGQGGKTYRYSKLVRLEHPSNDIARVYIHPMANWEGFAPRIAKGLDWYKCSVRAASAQEIAAGVALPDLAALVEERSTALATAEGKLEATHQIRLVAGTNEASLNSYVNGQEAYWWFNTQKFFIVNGSGQPFSLDGNQIRMSNIKVGTGQFDSLSVGTEQIVPGATTEIGTSINEGTYIGNGQSYDMISRTVFMKRDGFITVMLFARTAYYGAGNPFFSYVIAIDGEARADFTDFSNRSVFAGISRSFPVSAGWHTITTNVALGNSSIGLEAGKASMTTIQHY